jgi:hypothetical protein
VPQWLRAGPEPLLHSPTHSLTHSLTHMTELIDDWKRRKAKKKKGNHSGFTGDNNFDMSVLTEVRVSE